MKRGGDGPPPRFDFRKLLKPNHRPARLRLALFAAAARACVGFLLLLFALLAQYCFA